MKKLNKVIYVFIIFITFLFINSGFASATTLDVRNNLKNGSKGTQVELLQKELNSVMKSNLTTDGIFGSKTTTAVKQFQSKYGLTSDGIAGADTCAKLNIEYLSKNNYIIIYVSSTENNGTLNVRSQASSTSTKLGTIPSGAVYAYTGTKVVSGKTWYKIKFNGKDAYVHGSYAYPTGILLDLSDQILKVYQNGKLKLEAPVITGNNGNNGTVPHPTPTGKFLFECISKYKMSPATLRGTNDDGSPYNRPVTYWMNFVTNRGIGFHDATWRSSSQFYNKDTYLTKGSYGCVNMRLTNAKELYNLITTNTYVFVVK